MYDLVIIGAGPVGLAAAIQAKRADLSYLILDKGVLCNSIYNFPVHMRFFTTAAELEIGNHPFPSTDVKPTRQQTLDYYRRVTQLEDLNLKQHHAVERIEGEMGNFQVFGTATIKGDLSEFNIQTKVVLVATGYFDNPNGLGGIPGENLDIVKYYYDQPHGYYDHDVVIIGAGNSGAEAALELWRHGARVTIVAKYEDVKPTLKYWVGPDLRNRIKDGSIRAVLSAETKQIRSDGIVVDTPEQKDLFIEADRVFALTGFTPHVHLLRKWGLKLQDDLSVDIDDTFQTNCAGMFVIGSAAYGVHTNTVFIENGREHAIQAVSAIETLITPDGIENASLS